MKIGVTAVILTHNDQKTIDACVESLKWCNEVIVIDDDSNDDTLTFAAKHKIMIYKKSLRNDFAAQRNYALTLVKTEWALFVDADEVVTSSLATEISSSVNQTESNGFFMPRVDLVNGKKLHFGEFLGFSLLRLGRVKEGKWIGDVHETWEIKGQIGKLKNALLHYPQGGIHMLLRKINFYSTLRARELYKEGKKSGFLTIFTFPFLKFIYNFFLKLGFLDGVSGMVNAIAMSFYTFLVRSKLWFLWHEKKT